MRSSCWPSDSANVFGSDRRRQEAVANRSTLSASPCHFTIQCRTIQTAVLEHRRFAAMRSVASFADLGIGGAVPAAVETGLGSTTGSLANGLLFRSTAWPRTERQRAVVASPESLSFWPHRWVLRFHFPVASDEQCQAPSRSRIRSCFELAQREDSGARGIEAYFLRTRNCFRQCLWPWPLPRCPIVASGRCGEPTSVTLSGGTKHDVVFSYLVSLHRPIPSRQNGTPPKAGLAHRRAPTPGSQWLPRPRALTSAGMIGSFFLVGPFKFRLPLYRVSRERDGTLARLHGGPGRRMATQSLPEFDSQPGWPVSTLQWLMAQQTRQGTALQHLDYLAVLGATTSVEPRRLQRSVFSWRGCELYTSSTSSFLRFFVLYLR